MNDLRKRKCYFGSAEKDKKYHKQAVPPNAYQTSSRKFRKEDFPELTSEHENSSYTL